MIEWHEGVYCFRTITGIIIITDVKGDVENGKITWNNPLVVHQVPAHPGQQPQIAFEPLMAFGASNSCEAISKDQLMISYEPDKNLINAYNDVIMKMNAQKSGIVLPNKATGNIKPKVVK